MDYTKRQTEVMVDSVVGYLDHNDSLWSGDVPFTNGVNRLKGLRTDLGTAKAKQLISPIGLTDQKRSDFLAANIKAVKICDAVKFYANDNNNRDLYNKVNYVISDLNSTPYPDIEDVWSEIKEAAQSKIAPLAAYHIFPQTLLDFQALIDAYVLFKNRPLSAIKDHKDGTNDVAEIIGKIRNEFEKSLDLGITAYIDIDLDFNQGYWLRRELIDPGFDKLAMRINIVDNINHLSLQKVRMKIEETGEKHVSSPFGNIFPRTMPTGSYTLIFERGDLVTLTKIVHIEKGLTQDIHIQMEFKV